MQRKRKQKKSQLHYFLAGAFCVGLLFASSSVMSSDFDSYPENQIVLMEEVLGRAYLEEWRQTITAALEFFPVEEASKLNLRDAETRYPSIEYVNVANLKVLLIQKERKGFLRFIASVEQLYKGYDHLLKEEYTLALSELGGIGGIRDGATVPTDALATDVQTGGKGYQGRPESVTVTLKEIIDGFHYWKYYIEGEYPKKWKKINDTDRKSVGQPNHGIFVKTKNQRINVNIDVVHKYNKQVNHFNGFNISMLRAEAFRGLGDFRAAEQIYERLLFPKSNAQRENFAPFKLTETEKKFVRIRRATNLLEWGDYFFRRAHGLPYQEKQASLDSAKTKYQLAISQFPRTLFPLIESDKMNIDVTIRQAKQSDAQVRAGLSDLSDQLNYSVIKEINLKYPGLGGVGKMQIAPNPGSAQSPTGGGVFGQITNPLVTGAISHAKMQLFKIDSHLNFLGYADGYIPAQRYNFLLTRAKEYANLAIQSESRYIQFKAEAENQEYQARIIEQQSQIAGYPVQIARLRQKMAESQIKLTDHRVEAINRQIDDLRNPGLFGQLFGAMNMFAGIAAAPFSGGTSLAIASTVGKGFGSWMAGQISNEASTEAKISTLTRQRIAVQIEGSIAIKQSIIASLEKSVARIKRDYIRANLRYLQTRQFNREVYYNLAKALKEVKRIYMDAGIRMGYLTERALAFESNQPELQFVKFDYGRADIKNLMAGDFLLQDLVMMEYNRALWLKQRNHVKHVISLRQRYPIQFGKLIDTGEMTFATELYDFDKIYPGTYRRRLRRVEVVIQGLVGPGGFKGSLTNFGIFSVRTKDGTLNSSTTRLIPTQTKLEKAYREILSKGLTAIEVDGIHAYQLPPARLVLSKYNIREDGIIFPADAEVRETFEDFGVSGLWRLELPKNMNDVDYRTIADVQLILYFDGYYDPDLEKKVGGYRDMTSKKWVEGLVQKYEKELTGGKQLDEIAMFSLRQHFPDEFFSISSGQVEIQLLEGDFPYYMDKKHVKKVILRAVGKDGSGLAGLSLEVSKVKGNLTLTGTTNSEGYAQDSHGYMDPSKSASLPVTSREPIVGSWRIRLKGASQLKDIDDIFLFFMYEYEEKQGARGT